MGPQVRRSEHKVRPFTTASEALFADFSNYGYGAAILSESEFGFSCQDNELRISLLRAATEPDAEQDQGYSYPQRGLSLPPDWC
jgi:alpha-mannosidase